MRKPVQAIFDLIIGYVTRSLYRHHKGGLYRQLGIASESTNNRPQVGMVVYRSIEIGELKVRTLAEWGEFVKWPDGVHRPRFCPRGYR